MGRSVSIPLILLVLWGPAFAEPQQNLISTEVPAQRVRALQAKLHNISECGTPEACEEDYKQREPSFNQIRAIVAEFVVAQLNGEPTLDRIQLRNQLKQMLGPSGEGPEGFPYVLRSLQSSGANDAEPIVWLVAYEEWIHGGMGGSRTVVDCYDVERGRARLAGRGGAEMSGYGLSVHEILNPSRNSLFILVQGRLEWASGHELPAKATLYAANPTGIHTIWESKMLPGLDVSTRPGHTEFNVSYHDEARHQAKFDDPHTTVIETYVVGPDGVALIATERP
jgi:hypothetical protein